MKKAPINGNNGGVSKILIIVIVAVVVIAAIGAVGYIVFKNNSAEINYTITGIVVDDSDVIVYFNDEEIYKYEVEAENEFKITGTYFYNISSNEKREVTLSSKVIDKDGNVVQTLSEPISVTGNEKYQINLTFPSTTINAELTVDLTSDVTVTMSLLGGKVFGVYEVAADSEEVIKEAVIVVPADGVTIVIIKVAVEFSDGNTKHTEKLVDLTVSNTIDVALVVNDSTLAA
jgi:hypothetical protein